MRLHMKLFTLDYKYYLLLLFPLLLVACDNSNDPAPPPPPPTLTSIQVSADETTGLPVGYTRQYNAIGSYSDNSQKDITATVAWRSSTASATISTTGVATAVSVGSSEISATSSGITSPFVTLTVTNATAVSLVIERKQNNVDLPISRYEQLFAFIVFSDATVIDVTDFASWTSSQTGVITVDDTLFSPAKGEIFAVVNAGTSVITAADPNNIGTIMATVTIATSNATLTEVKADPVLSVSLPKGTVQEYTAQGLFSDGITRDLDKSRVVWESLDNTVATFIEDGLLQAESVGNTEINIIDQESLKVSIKSVSVTDATTVSILIVPDGGLPGDSVQLPVGRRVQYTAYSVYTDGSFGDSTSTTTFKSSDTSIAKSSGAKGGFIGEAVGTVTITASAGGLEAKPVELEVTSAVLETLTMIPNTFVAISPGEYKLLSVIGSFSDGSQMDVTKTVSWSSDNTAVAAVSNSELTKGLVTGRTPGTANITAASDENVNVSAIVNVIQ